jgi:hypothetical protein
MGRRPVYWKPKYATRSMRHRAWVRQEQKREARLAHDPSLSARLKVWARRTFRS